MKKKDAHAFPKQTREQLIIQYFSYLPID